MYLGLLFIFPSGRVDHADVEFMLLIPCLHLVRLGPAVLGLQHDSRDLSSLSRPPNSLEYLFLPLRFPPRGTLDDNICPGGVEAHASCCSRYQKYFVLWAIRFFEFSKRVAMLLGRQSSVVAFTSTA